jgi:cobalt/nickel transport system permease protein
VASSLAIAGALALQHAIAPEYLPAPPALTALALLLPSAAVTGVVEGVYTALALPLLRRAELRGLV